MDIEHLLHPVSPEQPCGPDLDDYDLEKDLYEAFSQLKVRLEGEMKKGELQAPRWPDIQVSALELASKTKHLHLAVILTESGLMTEGLSGFRDGLKLIHSWTRDFWPHLYPLDVRNTLIESLASARFLLKPKRVQLAKGPGGSFSFEDHERAIENRDSADTELSNQARLVLGTFQDTPRGVHVENLEVVSEALEHARQIEELFDSQGGLENSVNLADLRDLLSRMSGVLKPLAMEPENEKGEASSTKGSDSATSDTDFIASGTKVTSRQQAAEQLERIACFFEQNEPSSPMPYLLRRAQRCIGRNFLELIDELAQTKDQALQILSPEQPE